MDLRLKNALPSCGWCSGPCHPATAHVVTDEVPSSDPADIPDEYIEPPNDGLLGVYCCEQCVLDMFYDLKAAMKVEQGLVDWNDEDPTDWTHDVSDWEEEDYDDEDEDESDYWKFGE